MPLGSTVGTVVVVVLIVPQTVSASEGIVPTELSEAEDGPEFCCGVLLPH